MTLAKDRGVMNAGGNGALGFAFFLGWIGALVYFVQQNEGFGGFLLAILQSFVWPAYVVYHVLTVLNA
jgi:hypothetical protein